MKNRFQIRKLEFLGDEKKSSIDFQDGLNVIYGKSNTGKSLIILAIQYVFGKGTNVEFSDMNELKTYHTISLIIETNSMDKYIIERKINDEKADIIVKSLKDSKVDYYRPKQKTKLKPNISSFLTNLTSTEGLNLKKNAKGETLKYTFDKEMLISIINETKIIDGKCSPFLSGQFALKTGELSAFKVIFTDVDDSKCNLITDPKIYTENLQSNIKLLNELKKELLDELKMTSNIKLKKEDELNFEIEQIKKNIFLKNELLSQYMKEKKSLIDDINLLKSKFIFSQEILNRFQLHKKNLKNDAERLEFIVEGNFYINQLVNTECPLCNTMMDSTNVFNIVESQGIDFSDLENAYKKEFRKINTQLIDIKESINYHEEEATNIKMEEELIELKKEELEHKIKNEISEDLNKLYSKLEVLNNEKIITIKNNEKISRVQQFNHKICELDKKNNEPVEKSTYNKEIEINEINKYTEFIKKNLKDWNYSEFVSVSFDQKTLELSIDSKIRTSNGKGHRAIQASSMIIALLEYAIKNNRIHPGFVIIDSPLLSLREREDVRDDEILDDSITSNFYNKLALKDNMQIIILENKEPSINLKDKANLIEFTKDKTRGRYGLLL